MSDETPARPPSSHVIGMTQYYVCNLQDLKSPKYISTYDVSSCIVVVLRQITDNKTCSAFGMAHLNLCNVVFLDTGLRNLKEFVTSYQKVDGDLSSTSIDILGGLKKDENQVREIVLHILHLIWKEYGLTAKINVSPCYVINTTLEEANLKGNGEKLTICCDAKGIIHTRKAIFRTGRFIKTELLPIESTLLSNENLRQVACVDRKEHARLQKKTNSFYEEYNQLFSRKKELTSKEFETSQRLLQSKLSKAYCALEKCSYLC